MVNRDTMIKIIENAKGEGRKQGKIEELERFKEEVGLMPNADDRTPLNEMPRVMLLDGGSVHRFTLIKSIEKRLSELEEKGV